MRKQSKRLILLGASAIQPVTVAILLLIMRMNRHLFADNQDYLNAIFGLSILALLGLFGFLFSYVLGKD